jgi:hypothetical protein
MGLAVSSYLSNCPDMQPPFLIGYWIVGNEQNGNLNGRRDTWESFFTITEADAR